MGDGKGHHEPTTKSEASFVPLAAIPTRTVQATSSIV